MIAYTWVGRPGEYLDPAIPARSLDVAELPEIAERGGWSEQDLKARLDASTCYRKRGKDAQETAPPKAAARPKRVRKPAAARKAAPKPSPAPAAPPPAEPAPAPPAEPKATAAAPEPSAAEAAPTQ
jgi:hypothetical protein